MKNYILLGVIAISLVGCCRFESNTSTLIRKRIEFNEAAINMARGTDSSIAIKLYEDAITKSNAQLKRIADTIDGNDSADNQSGSK